MLLLTGCADSPDPAAAASPPAVAAAKQQVEMFVLPKATLKEMGLASDAILVGRFKGVTQRGSESDYANSGPSGQGVPVAVWDFQVERVVKGGVGSHVSVLRLDLDRIETDAQGPTPIDQRVVLFLTGPHRGDVYSVVALDQGLVELGSGEQLLWRTGGLGGRLPDVEALGRTT
jgi:hypothetical protein